MTGEEFQEWYLSLDFDRAGIAVSAMKELLYDDYLDSLTVVDIRGCIREFITTKLPEGMTKAEMSKVLYELTKTI